MNRDCARGSHEDRADRFLMSLEPVIHDSHQYLGGAMIDYVPPDLSIIPDNIIFNFKRIDPQD